MRAHFVGLTLLLIASCYGTPHHLTSDAGSPGAGGSGGTVTAGASGVGGAAAGATGAAGVGGVAGADAGAAGADAGAALEITSPLSPSYTNRAVTVQVSVHGGVGGGVQLLKNGTSLATLSGPPYAFTWETAGEQEGSYQIVAQSVVAGQIVMSAPVTIVVDRMPPTIVSSVPASGATNVSLTDPIVVVFSERLAPASVTGGSVRLALGSVVVNASSTLAGNGKTIAVAVSDRASLVLPGAMMETVASTIMDLAGNAFAGASWSASVPLWVDMGTLDGGYPQMVLDGAGDPIVARGGTGVEIARYTAGVWDTSIPSPTSPGTGASSGSFAIARGSSGDLFVTWIEGSALELARWTGTAWDRSWPSPASGSGIFAPAISVGSSGNPFISWVGPAPPNGTQQFVASWSGNAWSAYPFSPPAYGGCRSVPCQIVLDGSGFPTVEVANRLLRWTGSSWTAAVGTSLAALAINGANQVLSVQDTDAALQVVALSTGGSLTNYVPVLNASADTLSPDDTPQIAVDDLNEPIVLWGRHPAGNGEIHIARWTGAAWDQMYGVLTPAQGKAAIVLAQGSIPIVAWEDSTTVPLTTHVAKSNH